MHGVADDVIKGVEDALDPEKVVSDVIGLCTDAFKAIGKAFTHDRTITLQISTDQPMLPLVHWYDQAHDGVEFAGSQVEGGLGVVFHNSGPISGCTAFQVQGCDYKLYVAASNPLIGHNKARVEFINNPGLEGGNLSSSTRGCSQIWDDMDSWGEAAGNAHVLKNKFNVYDNPSSIAYELQVPDECLCPSATTV